MKTGTAIILCFVLAAILLTPLLAGAQTNTATPGNGTVTIGPPWGTGPKNINELIGNITNWVLGIAGAVAVLFIIISGLRYITAGGDSKQTEAAKSSLRNAIIGLVIVVVAFLVVQIIVVALTQ
jgi:heme/copper-type cytochrome/quinol oxidase subunit 2